MFRDALFLIKNNFSFLFFFSLSMTHYYPQPQQQVYYDPHQMYNVHQHIRPATNEGYQKEMTPTMTEKHVVYSDPPMTCCDRLCCGCCRCCPRWCRWFSCILFIFIGILLIITGILASQFKVPKVDFTGIQGTPSFGMNETMIRLGFDLGFSVTNPNIESVTFSSLKAQVKKKNKKSNRGNLQNIGVLSWIR